MTVDVGRLVKTDVVKINQEVLVHHRAPLRRAERTPSSEAQTSFVLGNLPTLLRWPEVRALEARRRLSVKGHGAEVAVEEV